MQNYNVSEILSMFFLQKIVLFQKYLRFFMMARETATLLRTVSTHWKNTTFVPQNIYRSCHVGAPLSGDILQGRWASSHQYQQLDLEGKYIVIGLRIVYIFRVWIEFNLLSPSGKEARLTYIVKTRHLRVQEDFTIPPCILSFHRREYIKQFS